MANPPVVAHYKTKKIKHRRGEIIAAAGECPICGQDYKSSVRTFKKWMKKHIETSHERSVIWKLS